MLILPTRNQEKNYSLKTLQNMTKVYVMATCPDCYQVKEQLKDQPQYEIIDIGIHVRYLKEFLRLRDVHPAFEPIKAQGSIGIPCFVQEDGNVSFKMKEVNFDNIPAGESCSLDGKGC